MKRNVVLLLAVCLMSFSGCKILQDWFGKKEVVEIPVGEAPGEIPIEEAIAEEIPTVPAVAPAPVPTEIQEIKSKEDFEKILNEKKPVVVKFETTACSVCQKTEPIFQEVANEFRNVKFARVNIDEQKELANIHNVKGVPTFQLFNSEGRMTDTIIGDIQKEDFTEKVANLLEK